jgi:hypothetical protein
MAAVASVLLAAAPLCCRSASAAAPGFSRVPVFFVENRGQTDPGVRFYAQGLGGVVFLADDGLTLALPPPGPPLPPGRGFAHPGRVEVAAVPAGPRRILRLAFPGSSPEEVFGEGLLPGRVHSLVGSDPARWRRDLPVFASVRYRGIYPGIDLIVAVRERRLEYDLEAEPGADLSRIRVAYRGADDVCLLPGGEMALEVGGGRVIQRPPLVYQLRHGRREAVAGSFVLAREGDGFVSTFALGPHDPGRPLVIDPILDWATYLGGSQPDQAADVAVDAGGNVLVTGKTQSADFPREGALDPALGAAADAFVVKFAPDGSSFLWATYLGGALGSDHGLGVATDGEGNVYLTGMTSSPDFPVVKAFDPTYSGSGGDIFVSKLPPDGTALLYSTYLGPGNGLDIAVDGAGSAYVTGRTSACDHPLVNPYQDDCHVPPNDYSNGFVTRFAPDGATLVWSTYLGGNYGNDAGFAIAVDGEGRAAVAGLTESSLFPLVDPLDPTRAGLFEGFVSRFSPDGTTLEWSTYLGGAGEDVVEEVAVDDSGGVVVAGHTASADFPTASPLDGTLDGDRDAFVARLAPDGHSLSWSTFLGGSGKDYAYGLALDAAGRINVAGSTESPDFPLVRPLDATYGDVEAFLVTLASDGSRLDLSTFLGGNYLDYAYGLAADPGGDLALAGYTVSTDFPLEDPLDGTYGSGGDAFVARISRRFVEDFSDGTARGDPDWKVRQGKWGVTPDKKYQASSSSLNLATIRAYDPRPNRQGAVNLEADVVLRSGANPNGALVFAYLDNGHYRWAGLTRGYVVIGQQGSIGGSPPGVWRKKAAVGIRKHRLVAVVAADHTVTVSLGTKPVLSRKFPGSPTAGGVGLRADHAATLFDNVVVAEP